MKIRILGSCGSDLAYPGNLSRPACKSVGFLIDDEILIDAGTAASALTFDEQKRLKHVLLSHFHFDHIKELPPLADNLIGENQHALAITAIPEVLQGLRQYIFNNVIFPDFFNLSYKSAPVLQEHPLEVGEVNRIGHLKVTPVAVNHLVPTVGFIIEDDRSAWIYSGDTHSTEKIWEIAAGLPHLKAAFIETSFPDEMHELAEESKHLTPTLLNKEYRKIGKPDLPLYVYHLKPSHKHRIISQLKTLDIPNLQVLTESQELTI